jgi:hypothetical protein
MQQETLVGCFVSKRLSANTLHHWTYANFLSCFGICPKIPGPYQGMDGLDICSALDTHKILAGNWTFGAQTLFLKKWSVDFDVASERVEISLVWVHLPGLPLIFWSDDVFKEIGNTIGYFYEVDPIPTSTLGIWVWHAFWLASNCLME